LLDRWGWLAESDQGSLQWHRKGAEAARGEGDGAAKIATTSIALRCSLFRFPNAGR
jgi:hypothetical protein